MPKFNTFLTPTLVDSPLPPEDDQPVASFAPVAMSVAPKTSKNDSSDQEHAEPIQTATKWRSQPTSKVPTQEESAI